MALEALPTQYEMTISNKYPLARNIKISVIVLDFLNELSYHILTAAFLNSYYSPSTDDEIDERRK